jgi:hypothetical protein
MWTMVMIAVRLHMTKEMCPDHALAGDSRQRELSIKCCRAGGAGPAADLAAAGQMAAAQRPAAGWASEFQRMRLDDQPAAQCVTLPIACCTPVDCQTRLCICL